MKSYALLFLRSAEICRCKNTTVDFFLDTSSISMLATLDPPHAQARRE